jgi:hypothetical protein
MFEDLLRVIAPLQGANSLNAGSRGGVLRHLPLAITFRAFGAVRSTLNPPERDP